MQHLLDKINNSLFKFTEAVNLSQLCNLILEEFINITEIDSGIILLQENGKFEQIYSHKCPYKIKINKKDSIHRTLKRDKLLIIQEKNIDKFNFLKKIPEQHLLCLPLIYHCETIGIIILFSNKKIKLKKMGTSLLILFANTASIIIKTKTTSTVHSIIVHCSAISIWVACY